MKQTLLWRYRLIGRDAGLAADALTNLHRCLAKIEERAEKLPRGGQDLALTIAINNATTDLGAAKRALGVALAELDKVTARVRQEERRVYSEAREKRKANVQ